METFWSLLDKEIIWHKGCSERDVSLMGPISKSIPSLHVLIPFPRMRTPSCEELRFLQKCLDYLNDLCIMNGSRWWSWNSDPVCVPQSPLYQRRGCTPSISGACDWPRVVFPEQSRLWSLGPWGLRDRPFPLRFHKSLNVSVRWESRCIF